MLRLAFLLVLTAVAALGLPGGTRPAAAAIEVRSQTVQNRFPDGLQFTLFTASDAEITEVRLRFRILPGGVNAVVRPQCTTGTVVNCNANVGSTRDSYMVPGAGIVYYWEISDASGARLITEEQTTTYADDRFDWIALTEGNLTVYYYFGDEASQRVVLNTAQETITRFSSLLRTTIDFPVKVWVYRTAAEMAPAVASRRGQGPDNSISTLGEVGAEDTALVSRDTSFLDIVRHEVTHIVTGAATRGYISPIPTWINEGLSTYSQRQLLQSEAQALSLAIQRNRVLPITSLNASARGSAGNVSIFYAQSGSLVAFMVERYGDDKFGEFIQALANDTTDGAMRAVYGFDQLGLENEWRTAVGLPPAASSGGGGGSGSQPGVPTLVPFGNQGSAGQDTDNDASDGSESAAGDDGGSSSLVPIVGGIAALIALAGAGFYLQNRRRAGA